MRLEILRPPSSRRTFKRQRRNRITETNQLEESQWGGLLMCILSSRGSTIFVVRFSLALVLELSVAVLAFLKKYKPKICNPTTEAQGVSTIEDS